MKNIKRNSIIAVGLTALSTLALGVGAISFAATQGDNTGFLGAYNLTAYAEENSATEGSSAIGVKQITISDKQVDLTETATFRSINNDGAYTLCLTVIDLADFGKDFKLPLQIGYEIAKGTYYNGSESVLSHVVYTSLTFAGGSSLNVSELKLHKTFAAPYFIVAEVPTSSIDREILNCIVAEKHNLEPAVGQSSTCTVNGWKDYYSCTDEGCTKYFEDSLGLVEIADLETWKSNDGRIDLASHTEVTDEAVEATCTESGLTKGSHCSVCGEVLVAQSVVDALGHSYENHVCTVCGDLEKVEVNGVYYQFTANGDSSGYHFVACGKANGFVEKYCTNGETLILENEIDGYPVTEIGYEAFSAKTDGNPIKSVIVPANIVTIGEKAFLDNVDMQSAVFLAPEVFVKGTYYNNSKGNTTPFYGCYTSTNKKKTALNVYYNAIKYGDSTEDLGWSRIYQYSSGALHYRFYIAYGSDTWGQFDRNAKGARITSGWSYVNLTVNNNTADTYDFESIVKGYVTEGLNPKTIYNAEEIRNSVQSKLDVLSTTQEKCLKYVASVVITKDDFGTTQIVVNVDVAETTYYLLTLSSATIADDGSAVGGITLTGGNYVTYNQAIYAANVTLTHDEVTGYKFVKYVSNGVDVTDNPYTLTLNSVYDVSVYYESTEVKINVISAVDYNHNGEYYSSSASGVECIISKDNVNVIPTAENHVFLGWAKSVNGSLEFTTIGTQNNVTYYAIWANNSRNNIVSATPTVTGSIPDGATLSVSEGSFYGWYADAEFTTQLNAISVDNTVLYARMQYTVSITGTVNSDYYKKEIYINKTKQESYSITVLEGVEIYINEQETNKVYTIYQFNQDSDDTLLVNEMRIKTSVSFWNQSMNTRDITVTLNGNTVTAFGSDNRFTINGSISININY